MAYTVRNYTRKFFFEGNWLEFRLMVSGFFPNKVYSVAGDESRVEVNEWMKDPHGLGPDPWSRALGLITEDENRFRKSSPSFIFYLKEITEGLHVIGVCMDVDKVDEFETLVNNFPPIEPIKQVKTKHKPGRHHFDDDIWAHNQVYVEHKKMDEVKAEWLNKISNDKNRSQIDDPDRQFRLIMEEDWGK